MSSDSKPIVEEQNEPNLEAEVTAEAHETKEVAEQTPAEIRSVKSFFVAMTRNSFEDLCHGPQPIVARSELT